MDVKVGDKVIISTGNIPDRIGAVTRVTNAGSFSVDCCGESLFDKTGRLKGAGVWDTTRADLATEEEIQRVKQEKVIRGVCQMCNKLKTTDITYNQAGAIWDILVNNLKSFPCVDVCERKHGHWFFTEYEFFDCSICGGSYYNGCCSSKEARETLQYKRDVLYKFCPFCGGQMDENPV